MKNEKYSYIRVLKEQLEFRVAKNTHYSLRAYARDLEINASRLSEILNNKKGLSEDAAQKIAHKLGLTQKETELFILSAKALHARSLKEKKAAQLALKNKLDTLKSIQKLSADEFELANNWYHLTILELLELDECDHSLEWFSKKLKLNKTTIKAALERLQKIGWIKSKNGKFTASHEQSETAYDVSSNSHKKFHDEMLKRAEHSLFYNDVNEREFLNMTLAFSTKQMIEAKASIRQFQKDFAEKYYSAEKSKDSVYQLSIQLFRLDSDLGGE